MTYEPSHGSSAGAAVGGASADVAPTEGDPPPNDAASSSEVDDASTTDDDSASSARAGPSERPPTVAMSAALRVRPVSDRTYTRHSSWLAPHSLSGASADEDARRDRPACAFSSRLCFPRARRSEPPDRLHALCRSREPRAEAVHVTPARGAMEGASIATRRLGAGRSAAGVDSRLSATRHVCRAPRAFWLACETDARPPFGKTETSSHPTATSRCAAGVDAPIPREGDAPQGEPREAGLAGLVQRRGQRRSRSERERRRRVVEEKNVGKTGMGRLGREQRPRARFGP